MFEPAHTIDRLTASHLRLLERLDGLTDDAVRGPSLLPDWSVGHVLSHLARNADSVVRRLEGCARDEIVDQYPGGLAGRAAEIEAGAHASADGLVDDLRTTAQAVEQVAAKMPADAWERLSRAVKGQLAPARQVLVSRIREVEIHHVDLGLGYRPSDWPADFVQETLITELAKLPDRADSAVLLGWLTDRGPAPALSSWG
jgi:maleylpyruvate isomerase